MRSVILATLALLVAAPAAHAAVSVSIELAPGDAEYGQATKISGTALSNGVPLANRPLELQIKRYPFSAPFAPLETTTTAADGTYSFTRKLSSNAQFRVIAAGAASAKAKAFVFPAVTVTVRVRSSRVIRLIQTYRVPKAVRLRQPTRFYVNKEGRKTAPLVASVKPKRIRAGRYRSEAVVHLPAAWKGRFEYATCFRYTKGSGMGDPSLGCPKRFPLS